MNTAYRRKYVILAHSRLCRFNRSAPWGRGTAKAVVGVWHMLRFVSIYEVGCARRINI